MVLADVRVKPWLIHAGCATMIRGVAFLLKRAEYFIPRASRSCAVYHLDRQAGLLEEIRDALQRVDVGHEHNNLAVGLVDQLQRRVEPALLGSA